MGINIDFFLDLYKGVSREKNINKEYILKIFIEYLLQIQIDDLDFAKMKYKKNKDGFEISVFANDEKYCPIYFGIYNGNEVDIQLNHGGEYLYLQPINDWQDIRKYSSALHDLFYSPIEEKIVRNKNKIISVSYNVNHEIDGKLTSHRYSIVLGVKWFWQKVQVEYRSFKPWLKRE